MEYEECVAVIVIAVNLTFDPSVEETARAAANRVAEATRAEDGCITYEFFADINRPGRMLLFEEWESAEALEAHSKTPHITEFRSALEAVGASREIKRYTVVED